MRKNIIYNGIETNYEIDDSGKVYNRKFNRELKGTFNTNEYQVVALMIEGKQKNFLVHRLVAEAFCENPNNYNIVDHINRNKYDNRAENLRWVTSSENALNIDERKKSLPEYYKGEFDYHWRNIEDSIYMVSEYGEVVNSVSRQILKPQDRNGYKRVHLGSKTCSVHILVWEAFNGKIKDNYQIDHIDGNKGNNILSNLREVSKRENMLNAYKNGHKGAISIYQYDLSGNFINKYSSIHAAAEAIGGNEIAIKDASLRHGTSSGYYWLREENKDDIINIINAWIPEGFKIIPSFPTYCISRDGRVLNKRTQKECTLHYRKTDQMPRIIIKSCYYEIPKLIQEAWGLSSPPKP